MNVKTEKLDTHVARLTVEIEATQLEKEKKKAARKLARRVNIPGFRKGKAPYNVLVSYVGEGPILEEAIESIGNEIYPKALEESEVEPYTSGTFEDFQLDPQPTFIFTVPMQPTVELNSYRDVRVEYDLPDIEDDNVDEALRDLQEKHALIEESQSPAALGDKITVDVSGHFVEEGDDEDPAESTEDDTPEAAHDEAEDEEAEEGHDHDAPIHQHDAEIFLDEEREPLPGFAQAAVGVSSGEAREFVLTYPEDDDKYGEFAGKEVKFHINVKKVENVTLPALNDEFAARVAEEDEDIDADDETMTLLQLRAHLREKIQSALEEQYKSNYIEEVMDEMVDIAEFAYPAAMVENQVDSMVEQTAQRFGVGVEDFYRLTQKSPEDMYADDDYREAAENSVKRSLVMRGILEAEQLELTEDEIESELSRFLGQFGDQADQYRSLFDTPEMRNNIANSALEQKIRDYIVAIGRGEDPKQVVEQAESDPQPDTETEASEPEPVQPEADGGDEQSEASE